MWFGVHFFVLSYFRLRRMKSTKNVCEFVRSFFSRLFSFRFVFCYFVSAVVYFVPKILVNCGKINVSHSLFWP